MTPRTNTLLVKGAGVLAGALLATTMNGSSSERSLELYQTTRSGVTLARVAVAAEEQGLTAILTLYSDTEYQRIVGIGGAFTESSADALSALPPEKRREVLEAYFSPEGAGYSLMRTHVGSCDFSLGNYSYAQEPGDIGLEHFSIEPDRKLLLPLIQDSQKVGGASFKLLASPWTAPPWMKDNGDWNGGRLLPEYATSFAEYLAKYVEAYEAEGVPIWGLTPMNEPEGNGENWESMIFNPEEMRDFIARELGPTLRSRNLDTKIYVFDQNRDHMREWADVIYSDADAAQYLAGMAVHWYSSTVSVCADELDAVHEKFPEMGLIHSEGCIDALGDDEPEGAWLEADWWWRSEATDWGWIWAPEEQKADHPKYVPVYRYARDLIGGLNHWMSGWIDWNIVLDFRGGPNHANNFCGAPVLVDRENGEVFYTPVYYAMCHFSRFIRPDAVRIGMSGLPEGLQATAVRNVDGSIVLVTLNEGAAEIRYSVQLDGVSYPIVAPPQSIQTARFASRSVVAE